MPIPKFLADLRAQVGPALILVPTVVVIARTGEGRLLMVHDRDAGAWTLPGGIVEPGETPADAAVREVFEETRLPVTLERIVGVVGGPSCETTYANGDRIAWVATVFAGRLDGSVPIADGTETLAAQLVTAEALQALHIRADSRGFLSIEHRSGQAAYFEPPGWRPG